MDVGVGGADLFFFFLKKCKKFSFFFLEMSCRGREKTKRKKKKTELKKLILTAPSLAWNDLRIVIMRGNVGASAKPKASLQA